MTTRYQHLQAIDTQEFDLCIIGGGATGTGCALDATLRGLKVCLIEKHDFAAQTSSKSTKMAHGGVRYLEQAFKTLDWEQFKMVKKALSERTTLLHIAPHLTRPLALLTPTFSWIENMYYAIGLKLYDLISGSHNIGSGRRLSKKQALEEIPELNHKKLHSAVLYYDGQIDDARFCMALAKTAVEKGAVALNHTEGLKFEYSRTGKLRSLLVKDLLTGENHTVKAKIFINATGPFADHIRTMANPKLSPRMRVSRGSHVMLPKDVIKGNTAILVPKTDDGRVVFIIPYQNQLLVGTTDIEDELSENPYPTQDEKLYLLEYVNRYLEKPVTIDQVKSGFCGLRPLLQARLHTAMDTDTKSIVRDHEVEIDNRSKLVSIMGGKWTTYRLMAKDTIDDIYRELWDIKLVPCTTETQLLCGAENYRFEDWETIATTHQIDADIAQHLQKKYGSRTEKVLQIADSQAFLKERVIADYPFIKAEVLYNMQEELACTPDDIITRRLGLAFLDEKAAKIAEPIVEELMLGYRLGVNAKTTV